MKIFKTTILVTVILFGLTAITSDKAIASNKAKLEVQKQLPCSIVFQLCDLDNPDDYYDFYYCMFMNGCG